MTKEEYLSKLKTHDWFYEFSDDFVVWRMGQVADALLRKAQTLHDPEFTLWNQYAPKDFKKERV